ncbi:GntR family transcriptional regulator [Flavobacterium faecale]|uniref:GntR family transcriptional regulator n=1 Tax=Flavobacterium faecale TaxID=1355330 RepID=UPI003AAEBB14
MYKQIVGAITNNISNGNIKLNQKLPSINTVSENLNLSRDTVEKAYNILKDRNIIISIPKKGTYTAKIETKHKLNILFLISKMSPYKINIYDCFVNKIGVNSDVNLVVYHCDELLFLETLNQANLVYDYYVVMPHFKTDEQKHTSYTETVLKAIYKIPKNKLLFLDNIVPPLIEDNNIAAVYQNFENDIYEAMKEGKDKIVKYKKIVLVYPERFVYPYPRRIVEGFKKFCFEFEMKFEILDKICNDIVLNTGDLFIIIEEYDLVNLIHQIRDNGLVLGEDLGIISYNDCPLKDLLNIATMTTDYKKMGETAAEMIIKNQGGRVKVPFYLNDRNSF